MTLCRIIYTKSKFSCIFLQFYATKLEEFYTVSLEIFIAIEIVVKKMYHIAQTKDFRHLRSPFSILQAGIIFSLLFSRSIRHL